jgi:hypothetical protein
MEPTDLQESLAHEIYRAMQRLGAPAKLLGIVGSWGDTLSEREVVEMLRIWNDTADAGAKQLSLGHQAAASGHSKLATLGMGS